MLQQDPVDENPNWGMIALVALFGLMAFVWTFSIAVGGVLLVGAGRVVWRLMKP